MTAKDKPKSKPATKEYRDNWERIFGIKAERAERECCGTFHGSPHRKTCSKWKGS